MKSFAQLNNYAGQTLDVEDARPARVVLDRPRSLILNQPTVYTTNVVEMPLIFSITEIINYQTALPKFIVTVISNDSSVVDNTTVSWPTQPTGLTFSTQGDSIIVTGFETPEEFNQLSPPTITFPTDYETASLLYVNFRLEWFDQESGDTAFVSYDIFDPATYFEAVLISNSGFEIIANAQKPFSAILASSCLFDIEVDDVEAKIFANFSINAQVEKFKGVISSIQSVSSLQNNIIAIYRPNIIINSFADLTADSIVYNAIDNIEITRSYRSNQSNTLFVNNLPFIDNIEGTYKFEFTSSSNGSFGFDETSDVSVLTAEGTRTQINDIFQDITYFPPKDFTGTETVTYKQFRNNSLMYETTFVINNAGASTLTGQLYTFETGQTWTPTLNEKKYATLDFILVAGGGGGGGGVSSQSSLYPEAGNAGSGGAGGSVLISLGNQISSSSYSLTIGQGGSGSVSGSKGIDGGDTQAFGLTAFGGEGGQPGSPNFSIASVGGDNSLFNGSSGTANSSVVPWAGGGGAGAASDGQSLNSGDSDPRLGGTELQPPFADSVSRGGKGGTGYRENIGDSGSGINGQGSLRIPGYGDGGGGGGGLGGGQEQGLSGNPGVIYIRTSF